MKPLAPLAALVIFAASSAFAQGNSSAVTGAIDAPKNRTSATEAKEDTRAGNKQAISPANAGTEAASKHSETAADQVRAQPSATRHRHPLHVKPQADQTAAPR